MIPPVVKLSLSLSRDSLINELNLRAATPMVAITARPDQATHAEIDYNVCGSGGQTYISHNCLCGIFYASANCTVMQVPEASR